MQNCEVCYGKRWYAKINQRTGLQQKNSRGQLLWRCYRCNHIQTEPDAKVALDWHVRTGASILYIDLEISKSRVFNYGLRVPSGYINPANLDRPYYMISWAASYMHQDTVYSGCVKVSEAQDWTDKRIVGHLHALMQSADIIAGHNVDRFDIKKANTRFKKWGLEPIIQKHTYDTLKIARKVYAFESNTLDYISKELGFSGKEEVTDEDWLKVVTNPDKATLDKILHYNKGDVINGKKVLAEMLPPGSGKPNYGSRTNAQIKAYNGEMPVKKGIMRK